MTFLPQSLEQLEKFTQKLYPRKYIDRNDLYISLKLDKQITVELQRRQYGADKTYVPEDFARPQTCEFQPFAYSLSHILSERCIHPVSGTSQNPDITLGLSLTPITVSQSPNYGDSILISFVYMSSFPILLI